MIKNYLLAAVRSLTRNKLFTLINTTGLAISFISCLAVFNLVMSELNVDDFHERGERIYRLMYDERPSGRPGARVLATSGPPAGPVLKSEFAEVSSFVRFRYSDSDILQFEGKSFYETGIFYADSSLFDVFSFSLKEGNEKTALRNKNSIVISQEVAKKYFGDNDPIGKLIVFNHDKLLEVTGVFDVIPVSSHLQFEIIIPFHAFEVPPGYPVDLNEWSWASFHTYFMLKNGVDKEEFESKLSLFVKANLPPRIAERFTFTLEPLKEVYFSEFSNDQLKSGTFAFIWTLIAIGAILLVLALLNFVNLNTSRLINRSREMGLRKVLGAGKMHVATQFLVETALIILIGALLSVPVYEALVKQHIPENHTVPTHLLLVLLVSIPMCVISTVFPAWSAWKSNILLSLKGEFRKGRSGTFMRKAFISLQFAMSLILITASIVVKNQLDFLQNKELGYDKNGLIVIETGGSIPIDRVPVFKSEFGKISEVSSVSFSSSLLDGNHGNVPIRPEGYPHEEGYPMNIAAASPEWLPQLDVELLAGRFSRPEFPFSNTDLIINEAALKVLQKRPEEVIGLKMRVGDIVEGNIVGVVKDFHFSSLHSEILPFVIFNPGVNIEHIYLKLASDNFESTLANLERTWARISPDFPFTYRFVDNHIQSLYAKDQQFRFLIQVFTYVAIFLSIFGLYGLVSFVIGLELKQMAIRKVLGASETSLYLTEVKLYFTLILLSALFSLPISYWLMNQWLNEFAFRLKLGATPFALGIGLISVIVIATISRIVVKAVKTNPVESIRLE